MTRGNEVMYAHIITKSIESVSNMYAFTISRYLTLNASFMIAEANDDFLRAKIHAP